MADRTAGDDLFWRLNVFPLHLPALREHKRDLGLLVGVNDAEAMKHIQPRFERPEAENGVD